MAISKRILGFGSAFVILALLAAGVYFRINADPADGVESARGEGSGVEAASGMFSTDVAIAVEGAEVVVDTMILSVTASGQAESWRQTRLTAEVAGRIDRVPVRESQRVGAGEVVLALDPVDYELEKQRAEVAVRRAQATMREQLAFDGNLADEVRTERERAARLKSGLEEAELQLKKAELDLERTRVRSPFPGRVADLAVVPGQRVSAGTELMTVADVDPIKVQVQVLEGELAHLAAGRQAQVRFAAFGGEVFIGRIETINPMVDQQTRTAKVTVLVPNPNGRILPGMYARVELEAQRIPDRTMVPRSAILERDRRTMLFVAENGRAKWRYVTTGLENTDHVEIVPNPETEMVEPGEIVLTAGHFTLSHDASIRLVDNYRQSETGRPQ